MLKEILTKEYNDYDFPFYNHNPRIPVIGWIVLFVSIFVSLIVYLILYDFSEFTASAFQSLVIIIPLLYYSKWNYSLIFHKPDKDEIILALVMFACYIIYAMIMITFLDFAGLAGTETAIEESVGLESYLSLVFYMMFEELLKFIPLMFFMRLFYKFSGERDISFIFSAIIVMVGFGLLHYGGGLTIYSVVLIQGLGTVFELFGYYKTKNLWISYLSHLLTDLFLMGLMLFP